MGTGDTLWYDFNLNVGDTLKPNYSFDTNSVENRPVIVSHNCLGRILIRGIVPEDKIIDVTQLKSGIYLIMVQDKEKKIFQYKFLKE
jgi:hypothetical protein